MHERGMRNRFSCKVLRYKHTLACAPHTPGRLSGARSSTWHGARVNDVNNCVEARVQAWPKPWFPMQDGSSCTSRPRSTYSIQIHPNARPPIAHSLLVKCLYIKYTNIRDDGQGCLHDVKNSPLTHCDDLPTNHQPAIIEGLYEHIWGVP